MILCKGTVKGDQSVDVQAALGLHCLHMQWDSFPHDMAQIVYDKLGLSTHEPMRVIYIKSQILY